MKSYLLSIADRDDFQMVALFASHELAKEFAERHDWDEDFYTIHEFVNHNTSDWDYYEVWKAYDGRTGVEMVSYWMIFYACKDQYVVRHTPGYSYGVVVESNNKDDAKEAGLRLIESFIDRQEMGNDAT